MGVYLSNIEMSRTHPITVEIYPDGTVLSKTVGRMDIHGKAVPVPPHGRLIDADALMAEFEKAENAMERHGREFAFSFISSGQEISTEWFAVETMVEDAPTIIPAKEDE